MKVFKTNQPIIRLRRFYSKTYRMGTNGFVLAMCVLFAISIPILIFVGKKIFQKIINYQKPTYFV